MKKLVVAVSVFVVLGMITVVGLLPKPVSVDTESINPQSVNATLGTLNVFTDSLASAQSSQPSQIFVTGLEHLPASLRDTQVDGMFRVSANGELLLTRDIRQIFDYFLTTIGEEDVDRITARMRAYINHQLQPPARAQAQDVLTRYMNMKRAMGNVDESMLNAPVDRYEPSQLKRRKETIQQIRNAHLSADEIQAFYADEDAYDNYTLSRLDVMNNTALSPQQRAEQINSLQQQLPQRLRDNLQQSQRVRDLNQLSEALAEQGGTQEQLRDLRVTVVGEAAAERLAKLDEVRKAWDARLNNWLAEKKIIEQNQALSSEQKTQAITQRRAELFNEAEQKRLYVLEKLSSP